jgi:hypothetical protein
VTPAHAWRLFASLPLVVQAWVVLLAAVVFAGVWSLSRGAGRLAGRIEERRTPDAAGRVHRERDHNRHMRAVANAPQSYIDQALRSREIECAGELDLDGDDVEEADHGCR